MYNKYFTFQPDLIKAMPILKDALILTNDLDPLVIQDLICHELLPNQDLMIGTTAKLLICTVINSHGIAYWDLIFSYPLDDHKSFKICQKVEHNTIELDDSFNHSFTYGNGLYKISFKVG